MINRNRTDHNSGGGISEEIFNDEPIIQGSGCMHAINQQDRPTLMIVMVNADFTIYDLPMFLTYREQESHNCVSVLTL